MVESPLSKQHGFLVVDKPLGVTSRDLVNAACRKSHRRTRIGHAGTLDPLATGVLVLCFNNATKLVECVQDQPKTYIAEICLGATSTTDDAEGEITPTEVTVIPERNQVESALSQFCGEIWQTPPLYSAVKIHGKRAYEFARGQKDVQLSAKKILVYDVTVHHYDYPKLTLEITCGKGTYIRSIARDLGEHLNTGAYLTGLQRTAVGPFRLENAQDIEQLKKREYWPLLPIEMGVDSLPKVRIDVNERSLFQSGQFISNIQFLDNGKSSLPYLAVFAGDELVGLGVQDADGLLRPKKVFSDS